MPMWLDGRQTKARRVVVRFTVEMLYDVFLEEGETPDLESFRYFIEEHNCRLNLLSRLAEEHDRDSRDSVCNVCQRSTAELLRWATPDDEQRLNPSRPSEDEPEPEARA